MAIHAALRKHIGRRRPGGQAAGIVGHRGVSILRVATLAKQRRPLRQHTRMVRAMRGVAQPAILADRRVLPKIGATLVRVALIAGVVQRCPRQFDGDRITVHAMASGAGHLFLEQRVREGLQGLVFLQLVAPGADVGLRRWLGDGVDARVALVAVGAGNVVKTVRTRVPANTNIVRVTVKAHAVFLLDGGIVAVVEVNQRWTFLATSNATRVRVAGTVAGLTLQLTVTEGAA